MILDIFIAPVPTFLTVNICSAITLIGKFKKLMCGAGEIDMFAAGEIDVVLDVVVKTVVTGIEVVDVVGGMDVVV